MPWLCRRRPVSSGANPGPARRSFRALQGPRKGPLNGEELWKAEVVRTLGAIKWIRGRVDGTELGTVEQARQLGMSWAEIGSRLGISRQAAWEKWHELDEETWQKATSPLTPEPAEQLYQSRPDS